MIANFHIHYQTIMGQRVNILIRRNQTESILHCQTFDGAHWFATLTLGEKEQIEYKYQVESPEEILEEWGAFRQTNILPQGEQLILQDTWRAQSDESNAYFSAAFADVIFKRNASAKKEKKQSAKGNTVTFQLHAAAIPAHLKFCILGDCEVLGFWQKPIVMSDSHFPYWQASINVDGLELQTEYKFALYDEAQESIIAWENGDNRKAYFSFPTAEGNVICRTDEGFRYPFGRWRGAGVAIPVFSLRSHRGLGIGEYTDLPLLIDWAVATGLKMVQTLPVNDTIATQSWLDSYPYAAISVFGLHPLYVNIQSIAPLKDKALQQKLTAAINTLNHLETVDFEAVLEHKTLFFKALYQQEKQAFWKDKAVTTFVEKNQHWLKPYAAFCYLRDKNGTSNFNLWKSHATFSEATLTEICNPKAKHFDEVALYYFIQFHADKQLFEATTYARSKGVILKGDLPIGIYRYSCDAWVAPQLYNMDGQAGAPPDDFAVAGQNWGFPTYNWEVMAADNFAWWQQRMTKLSEYFDALRIDHILGFFRIWQIPTNQVEGTLGLFNPRLPYTLEDLAKAGLQGHLERFTKPYIRQHFLAARFGENADWVRQEFLTETSQGVFELKEFCDNQLKIKELFQQNKKYTAKKEVEKALYRLVSEVLLIEEPGSNGTAFNPRITLSTTQSFQELDHASQAAMSYLYNDYFFVRHDDFWRKQAYLKLPALLKATNMLICGEDLGMIPNSVPGVMKALNIIALEIQRMPRGATEFGDPSGYPYMSVCSPSCHDMSTVRGWWESDSNMAQRFYQNNLQWYGAAPQDCKTEIVESIVYQHLTSPSMWAVFPIQDLVGMDASLRRPNAAAEQINNPADSQHYWRFRFHRAIEDLLKEKYLSEKIKGMVQQSGRAS
jgi:4-alpha-glucanotransferase